MAMGHGTRRPLCSLSMLGSFVILGGESPTTLRFVEFSRSCHTRHRSESGHILDVEVYILGLLGSYPHTLGLQDPRVLRPPHQLIKVLVSCLT
jgi:hypothetical protein